MHLHLCIHEKLIFIQRRTKEVWKAILMTQFAGVHANIATYATERTNESLFQTKRTLRTHNSLLLLNLNLISQEQQVRKCLTSQLFPQRPPWKRSSFQQTLLLRCSHTQLHQWSTTQHTSTHINFPRELSCLPHRIQLSLHFMLTQTRTHFSVIMHANAHLLTCWSSHRISTTFWPCLGCHASRVGGAWVVVGTVVGWNPWVVVAGVAGVARSQVDSERSKVKVGRSQRTPL